MVKITIGELFIELGFKADTLKLQDFMHSVAQLNMTSVMTALGLGAMYEATSKIMGIADQTAMSIFGFTQVTGLAGKEMQQFSNYMERMGVSAGESQSSIKNLQMALFKIKIGEGDIKPFALVGIDVMRDDIYTVIQKMTDLVNNPKVDAGLKRMLISASGFSENMLIGLKGTRDIASAIEDMPFASEKEVNNIREYHAEIQGLGQDWKLALTGVGAEISPIVDGLLALADNVIKIVKESKALQIILLAIGAIVAVMFMPFGAALVTITAILAALGAIVHYWDRLKGLFSLGNLATFGLATPLMAMAGQGASHSEQHNDIDFNISGALNPTHIAKIVGDEIKKILTDRYYHEQNQKR